MSAYDICINAVKPWLNARVYNLIVDGTANITGGTTFADVTATTLTLTGNMSNQLMFKPTGAGTTFSVTAPGANASVDFYAPSVSNTLIQLGVDMVNAISSTTTLGNTTSGQCLSISGGSYSIVVPSVVAGCKYRIIVSATLSGPVTFSFGSGKLYANVIGVTGTNSVQTTKTQLILGTTSSLGDKIDIESDGNLWYAWTQVSNTASITFA